MKIPVQYVWFIWSLLFLAIWLLVYLLKKDLRREMLWMSVMTAPFGLTEPLFVPSYWNPPSLFNLAQMTGFDIESIIFSFAIGGLGAILYELIAPAKHATIEEHERHRLRHKFHLLALISPAIVFVILALETNLNHIYCAIIAMFFGGITSILCRPDLNNRIWTGGTLFLGLYFIFFAGLNLISPGYVRAVWNLPVLSHILILGIPLEEMLFAFTFGMLWSSFYEHVYWRESLSTAVHKSFPSGRGNFEPDSRNEERGYSLRYLSDERRRSRPKGPLPEGNGHIWPLSSSLFLGVPKSTPSSSFVETGSNLAIPLGKDLRTSVLRAGFRMRTPG